MKLLKLAGLAMGFISLSSLWTTAAQSCPSYYMLSTCSFQEYSATGNNSCIARHKLHDELARWGIDSKLVEKDISCFPTGINPPDPVCTFEPTSTTCSVTANGQTFSATTTECDSPIGELLDDLHAALVKNTKGLIAYCQTTQHGNVRKFSVVF